MRKGFAIVHFVCLSRDGLLEKKKEGRMLYNLLRELEKSIVCIEVRGYNRKKKEAMKKWQWKRHGRISEL